MAVAARLVAMAPRVVALGRGGFMALGYRRVMALEPRALLALELVSSGAMPRP